MYSYVLHYNIEKFHVISPYIFFFFIKISLILPIIKYKKTKFHLIVSSMTKDKNRGGGAVG